KSLPFVQDVVPAYQGQLQLNSQGNILNSQVMGMDASKVYLVNPSLQLVDGSSIQPNNPSAILVGDSIANPPGMTTPFVTVGNNIGVVTPKAILAARQQFQSGNSSFILDIAFIALLVGAVGIITTLYTSVNERIKEIGTMKAIGAKNRFILSLFMSEALLIGLLGATSGILIGIGGAYVLTGMSPHSSSA